MLCFFCTLCHLISNFLFRCIIADPASGSIRQPLLKVIALLRNLDLAPTRPDHIHQISRILQDSLGQSPTGRLLFISRRNSLVLVSVHSYAKPLSLLALTRLCNCF